MKKDILVELSYDYIECGFEVDLGANKKYSELQSKYNEEEKQFLSSLTDEQKKIYRFDLSNIKTELDTLEVEIGYRAGWREAFKFFTNLQASRG